MSTGSNTIAEWAEGLGSKRQKSEICGLFSSQLIVNSTKLNFVNSCFLVDFNIKYANDSILFWFKKLFLMSWKNCFLLSKHFRVNGNIWLFLLNHLSLRCSLVFPFGMQKIIWSDKKSPTVILCELKTIAWTTDNILTQLFTSLPYR